MNEATIIHETRRQRRAALINLTLTDLLIVVVFVLLFFVFRADEEGRSEVTAIQAQLAETERERDRLKKELTATQIELARLNAKLQDLEELIKRLLEGSKNSTLPVNPREFIESLQRENKKLKGDLDALNRELESREELIQHQQSEIAKSNIRLKQQGKGTGFPRCLVTAGFLLEVRLLPSGQFLVAPLWEAGANKRARAVPGVVDIIGHGEISIGTFRLHAKKIKAWAESQEVPCRFRVKTIVGTKDLEMYRRQMRAIDEFFYPTR